MIDASWEVEKTDPRDKFRESLVERAELRLSRAEPARRGVDEWELPGYEDLGDEYPRYIVRLAGDRYVCTCYGHYGGEVRQRRICSHVLAVILWRKSHRDDFPTPAELGLPVKFTSFRPVQVEALKRIMATDKRWILLQAPTGSGKSLLAAAAQKLLKTRMLYTCHSRDLQDQFVRDFSYAVKLKGRENYPTAQAPDRWPEIHCGLCTKTKADPRCRWCCPPGCYKDAPCLAYGEGRCETGWRTCPYEEQKKAALVADVAVLNFAMFLGEANYAGGFGGAKFPLVVCDEADLLEAELMSFAELTVSPAMIERLGLEPPRYKTKEEAWVEWVKNVALPRVIERLAELEDGQAWGTVSVRELREKRDLERVKSKLGFFLSQVGSSKWVNCTENVEEGPWVWKPVYVSDLASRYLWRHGERFLLMSATILEPKTFARNLGIPDGEWEFIDLPSTFPKENRPVVYVPVANMTHKTMQGEWPKVVEATDAILDAHPNEKVLVHTVSYALSRYVAANTRHRGRVIIYDGARDRAAALERFRASSEPLVMLAPSMERGVDLPDDLCRVVVVLKVPYRSLGDKQVSARLYGSRDGRAWYVVDAIRTLVQMSGRGVRHERDWCLPTGSLVFGAGGEVKTIESFRVGDRVIGGVVTEVMSRNYRGPLIEIRAWYCPPVLLTPEHPVWAIRKPAVKRYEGHRYVKAEEAFSRSAEKPAWIPAGDLKVGDYVGLPIDYPVVESESLIVSSNLSSNLTGVLAEQKLAEYPLSREFLRLCGLYLAEGSANPARHNEVTLVFGANETDLVERTASDLRELGIKPRIHTGRMRQGSVEVQFSAPALGAFLRSSFGSGAANKRLPRWFFSLSREKRSWLLEGYCDGDEHREPGRVSLTTVSKELAYQLWLTLLQLGRIPGWVKPQSPKRWEIKGRSGWTHTCYSVRETVQGGGRPKAYSPVREGFRYFPIRSVREVQWEGVVWNLAVEPSEAYMVPGLFVHNCKTYILDAQFGIVLKEWKSAFPKWWLESLETRPAI